MMVWKKVLEEIIVNCIRNNGIVEDYNKKDDKNYFMLTEEAQKYLYEVRKRYMAFSEAVNCMDPEDFVEDLEEEE